MIIKVKHKAIEDITKTINQDQEDFDKEIDNMLGQIERLKAIWQGTDANVFYEKVTEYIKNMKKITNTMKTISNFSNSANKGFIDVDQSFGKDLEEEANKYDESDYQ